MPVNNKTARALCTGAEWELVLASLGEGAMPKARVKLKIGRARALRDKYRGLTRRQRLAARSRTGTKLGARPGSNARTEEKARLFAETLARFESRLRKLEAAERHEAARMALGARRAAAKAVRARSAPPAPRRGAKPPKSGYVSESARQASRRQRLQNMRVKTLQAHARAQGRRRQARRDARSR
jgi:hypothetical protein